MIYFFEKSGLSSSSIDFQLSAYIYAEIVSMLLKIRTSL